LGSPLPVRPQRSPNAWPFRYSFHHPRPRTRLLGRSSLGVQLSFTAAPEASARGLSTGGTSLGVLVPFSALGGRSLRTSWLPRTISPVARDSADGSHPADYGAAHRFSQPPSGFCLPPPPRHFQTGGTPGVHSSGDCSSHEALTARRRQRTLMTFFLRIARVPDLGGNVRRRGSQVPRRADSTPFIAFRVLLLVRVDPHLRATLMFRKPTYPS
jgi:hypothetical protein